MSSVKLKRVYEAAKLSDGYRILVDRLWPRGISKEKAKINLWLKEVGPSNELRQWFGHDPARWLEFKKKFAAELKTEEGRMAAKELKEAVKQHTSVTLVFAAKDIEHNNAVAIKQILRLK